MAKCNYPQPLRIIPRYYHCVLSFYRIQNTWKMQTRRCQVEVIKFIIWQEAELLYSVPAWFIPVSTLSARLPSSTKPRNVEQKAPRVGLTGCFFVGHWTHWLSNSIRKLLGVVVRSNGMAWIWSNSGLVNPSSIPWNVIPLMTEVLNIV